MAAPDDVSKDPLNFDRTKEMDLFMSTETAGAVAADLIGLGCCSRCVLRHLGEETIATYKQTAEEIAEAVLQLCGEGMHFSASVCPACLGMLQHTASTEFLHNVKSEVEKAGYEFFSYQCSIQQPVCLPMRQRALFLYLKDKFECYRSVSENDIPSVKDVWKWFSGPILNQILGAEFQMKSIFDISVSFEYAESDRECTFLLDLNCGIVRRKGFKQHSMKLFNRTNVASALNSLSDALFKKNVKCPPSVPESGCKASVTCCHESVFLAGRYMKYSRTLSQTPWIVEGERKTELSIQELICEKILEHFKPSDHRFSSAGREDMDVRMLGSGRPFVVELVDPHRVKFSPEELWKLQESINSSTTEVAVRDLQIVSKTDVDTLKIAETDKTKTYTALCWSPEVLLQEELDTLTKIKDLVLKQKTPVRVLHRRPLLVRERTVHSMKVDKKDDHHFGLQLTTQAGTYVKEFVHGDFGRTQPNLSSLLGHDCDILELDVTSVDVDWPKTVEAPIKSPMADSPSGNLTTENGSSGTLATPALTSSAQVDSG